MKHAVVYLFLVVASLCFAQDKTDRCILSVAVPSYPKLAQAARIEGIVKVKILVNERGDVVEASPLSGHEMLKRATAENVRAWKFAPAPGKKTREIFITYLYFIEGSEVPPAEQRCARVMMDLPTRVEITVPPLPVETMISH